MITTEHITLKDAAAQLSAELGFPVSHLTLRSACNRYLHAQRRGAGLKGQKQGRDWFVLLDDAREYIQGNAGYREVYQRRKDKISG